MKNKKPDIKKTGSKKNKAAPLNAATLIERKDYHFELDGMTEPVILGAFVNRLENPFPDPSRSLMVVESYRMSILTPLVME